MRLVLLIALPAAVGLVLLAGPLVTTIFFGGVFSADDVRMTALALQARTTPLARTRIIDSATLAALANGRNLQFWQAFDQFLAVFGEILAVFC